MGFRDALAQKADEKANSFGDIRLYGGKVFNSKTTEGKPFTTTEATHDFRLSLAKHIHGHLSASDIEPMEALYKTGEPGTPVVITGDGKGCVATTAHHWRCEAYVYMNTIPQVYGSAPP